MTDTVTVKPLVWESVHREYVETYQANCAVGIYRIFEDEDSAAGAIWIEFAVHEDRFGMVDAVEVDRIYGEFSDAKAAAQTDYERRIRSALEPQTPAQAARVLRNIEPDDGFWRSCSGCHETIDGQETGWHPYSPIFKCHLGAGCRECGGLGAVWDDTDYEDMARAIAGGE